MRISVVTVHLNDFEALHCTVLSVASLRRRCDTIEIEWIVIDGGSDFSSQPTLRNLVDSAASSFVSAKDDGIYDAMNKGAARASGDYVIFMNAGDRFVSTLTERELLHLLAGSDATMAWGAAYESRTGMEEHLKLPRDKDSLWYGMPTHHQAMFFRRDVVSTFKFDCRYRIAADYKLVCEIAMIPGAVIKTMTAPVCVFDLSGMSSRNYWAGLKEQQAIRRTVLGIGPVPNLAIFLLKSVARAIRVALPTAYGRARYGVRES